MRTGVNKSLLSGVVSIWSLAANIPDFGFDPIEKAEWDCQIVRSCA